MSFSKAHKSLLDYAPKRLGHGSFVKDGLRCAVGAICDAKPGKEGSVLSWPPWMLNAIWRPISAENDSTGDEETPEDRYVRMLGWLKKKAIEEKR